MFKLKLKKHTNYALLHWSLFVGTAVTITFKILEITSSKSMEIFVYQPELAKYSVFVHMFG